MQTGIPSGRMSEHGMYGGTSELTEEQNVASLKHEPRTVPQRLRALGER